MYRPFNKQKFYFDSRLNEMVYLMPKLFPAGTGENRAISVLGVVERMGFSVLMTDIICNVHFLDTSQCFPLYYYDEQNVVQGEFKFAASSGSRKHAISDNVLMQFQNAYPNESPSKEDIFYYIYGLLHSEEYRERFKDNLSKEL